MHSTSVAYDHRRNHNLTSHRVEKDNLRAKSEQVFEARISSAFATMRADIGRIARETNAYADGTHGLLGQLGESQLHKHAGFQTMQKHLDTNKEKFDDLLSTYSSLLNELAPWRKQAIHAGEQSIEIQSAQMQQSRKDIMNVAKRRLDEGREKQQLATDASELMQHYKALIIAT